MVNESQLINEIQYAIANGTGLSVVRFSKHDRELLAGVKSEFIERWLRKQNNPYALEIAQGIVRAAMNSDYVSGIASGIRDVPSDIFNGQLSEPESLKQFNCDVCIVSPGNYDNSLGEKIGLKVRYLKVSRYMDIADRSKFIRQLKNIKQPLVLFNGGYECKDIGLILKHKVVLDYGKILHKWAEL